MDTLFGETMVSEIISVPNCLRCGSPPVSIGLSYSSNFEESWSVGSLQMFESEPEQTISVDYRCGCSVVMPITNNRVGPSEEWEYFERCRANLYNLDSPSPRVTVNDYIIFNEPAMTFTLDDESEEEIDDGSILPL